MWCGVVRLPVVGRRGVGQRMMGSWRPERFLALLLYRRQSRRCHCQALWAWVLSEGLVCLGNCSTGRGSREWLAVWMAALRASVASCSKPAESTAITMVVCAGV